MAKPTKKALCSLLIALITIKCALIKCSDASQEDQRESRKIPSLKVTPEGTVSENTPRSDTSSDEGMLYSNQSHSKSASLLPPKSSPQAGPNPSLSRSLDPPPTARMVSSDELPLDHSQLVDISDPSLEGTPVRRKFVHTFTERDGTKRTVISDLVKVGQSRKALRPRVRRSQDNIDINYDMFLCTGEEEEIQVSVGKDAVIVHRRKAAGENTTRGSNEVVRKRASLPSSLTIAAHDIGGRPSASTPSSIQNSGEEVGRQDKDGGGENNLIVNVSKLNIANIDDNSDDDYGGVSSEKK